MLPKKPSVNVASAGDKTVSGKITIGSGQRKAKMLDVIIHVTVNRQAGGTEEKTVVIPPKAKANWEVTLGSELVAGDKVTVKQEFEGGISEGVVLEIKKGLNDQHKDELQMPSGEIWIEQAGAANIVNEEEQAEALRLVKEANPAIAGDIKSVELKISGTSEPKTAKINVTYTDDTTSGEIEAPDLTVKQVTERSRSAEISDITVVDNVIEGKLQGAGPFNDIKLQIFPKINKAGLASFNNENGCTTDKDSPDPIEVSVDSTTGKFTYRIPGTVGLPHTQIVGVSVKEKNKFVSCETTTVKLATPQKTEVRDPKKLTDADKKAIDAAIRKANTINGTSKLPDGTGFVDDPAFIEFDKEGNVTIISPNDVEVTWDSNHNPVYTKNPDGTYKLASGKENNVIKIPVKDLVKNVAPASPEITVDTNTGTVTITPPAYENLGDDTDLASYTFTYTDASGAEKTVTATRTVDKGSNKTTWTADNATVDANTGVITLSVEDIEVGGTIKAIAKDNGGLVPEEKPLESDPATKTLETVNVSYDRNGGTGDMDGKKLNKGSKYTILSNAFTAPENEKFKTWKIGETEYAAGAEITVKEDTTIQAVWQDIEVTVSYSPNGGSGKMVSKTLKQGSKYKVLPNAFVAPDDTQEFKAWEVDGQEVAPGTEIIVKGDTVVRAVWKKIPVKVSYDANGGSGSMDDATVDKGSKYKVLPNAFVAPDDTQEFKAWEVDGQEVAPGTEIIVKGDTVVRAVWKKIPVKVSYDANGGSGSMDGATVDKGSKYTVLPNGFTAPDDTQEFKAWEVDGQEVAPGTEIIVKGDTVVRAVWKKIPVSVRYDANGGSGSMDGATVDKGSKYTVLPNGFTAPDDTQEFKAWLVDGQEVAPGTEITVNGDTVVKAVWKKIPVDNPNGGSNNNGDGATKASKSRNSGKLPKTGYAGMPYQVAAMILVAGGLLIAGSKKTRKH
ncbi:InlB B-repeat-containing protein [Schaalia turicensis]|uniref:InlB B-repeat-containing protein n=1 Tax=Schaalia turicensis TaxID=131111 RepID=UPI0013FD4D32|nr:InlB B-repeat-containing protein [Schaalia turicensis]